MKGKKHFWRVLATGGLFSLVSISLILIPVMPSTVHASPFSWWRCRQACSTECCGFGDEPPPLEVGGSWYWLRSPEQEKRVVLGLYNRFCIRCHGVDGRGVWDIPDVP